MKKNIAIIGLGYVGLPLAIAFSKKYYVKAYDSNIRRISELKKKIDLNNEIKSSELIQSIKLIYTNKINDLKECNVFIVTVPTPIKKNKNPDLSHINNACKKIGQIIKKEDIVIFESTVYPGLTEDHCAPLIERFSGLRFNKDFYCGYSPERVNPGDTEHNLNKIIKITSGSTKKIANIVDKLYSSVIQAGTYKVSNIRVAEAAKVIENTQRDLNVAFVNELSMIFNKLNLDTDEILKAAATKWNFQSYRPGLVGGHCIGVDPYYLTYKAKKHNHFPKIILAGRNVNDKMSNFVSTLMIKKMKEKKINIYKSKILILGFTFKENCTDIRNSKVIDVYKKLIKRKCIVDIFDPLINIEDTRKIYNINIISKPKKMYYDGILLAVPHKYFVKLKPIGIKKFAKLNSVFFDLKNVFAKKFSDIRL